MSKSCNHLPRLDPWSGESEPVNTALKDPMTAANAAIVKRVQTLLDRVKQDLGSAQAELDEAANLARGSHTLQEQYYPNTATAPTTLARRIGYAHENARRLSANINALLDTFGDAFGEAFND